MIDLESSIRPKSSCGVTSRLDSRRNMPGLKLRPTNAHRENDSKVKVGHSKVLAIVKASALP
jgi:hypothetical protein